MKLSGCGGSWQAMLCRVHDMVHVVDTQPNFLQASRSTGTYTMPCRQRTQQCCWVQSRGCSPKQAN